jgi:peptidoglycan/LPS O-acetylase OafA/YrhL
MGAIRLFLALAVVQSHIYGQLLAPAHLYARNSLVLGVNGGYAVAFFFVISGFLISFVLEEKYSRPGGTAAFYRARALRVYPLWWALFFLVPFVTSGSFWEFAASRHVYDLLAGFFLYGSDWLLSFAAYPHSYTAPTPHGLEPGWTLATEMTFYLIAPFVLRSRFWPFAILVVSVIVRTLLAHKFPQTGDFELWNNWCYYFFPSVVFFFMLGHLGRQLHKRLPLSSRMGWSGLAIAALICLAQDGRYHYDNVFFYAAIVTFAVSLPAIFAASKDNRFCNFLGDLTYPLYLAHGTLIALLAGSPWVERVIFYIAQTLPGHRLMFVYVKAAVISWTIWSVTLLVAVLVRFAIEKPAIAVCRKALACIDRARRPAGAVPARP